MIVGFQGAPGAFSDEAARALGASVTTGYRTFDLLLTALDANEIPYALLPVHNTTIGGIEEAKHALARRGRLRVVGAVEHRIVHCLLGCEGARLTGITEVRSHRAALVQCARFFTRYPRIELVQAFDTAGALATIVGEGDARVAAIGPAAAAERYGGAVLARGIQDRSDNATRFVLLKKGLPSPT